MYSGIIISVHLFTGILASGVYSLNSKEECIVEAANAAVTVVNTFSGICLPGLPYTHPSVKIGFHVGEKHTLSSLNSGHIRGGSHIVLPRH